MGSTTDWQLSIGLIMEWQ